MCGIVGVVSQTSVGSKVRQDWFNQALYTDALRGWDSTGIFTVSRGQEVDIFKRAVMAQDFMSMKPYGSLSDRHSANKFIVGHNRKATKGGITNQSAHPFEYGNIVMVHNGTLVNHRSLPKGNTFDVDSEALTYAVNDLGAEEAFERADGAFACVWYDRSDDTINMIRNDERPLTYAYVNDGLLFASEKLMLMWLADRNDIKINNLIDLPEGEIHKFHVNKVHSPEVKKVNILPTFEANWYGRSYSTYPKQTAGQSTTTNTTSTKTTGSGTTDSPSETPNIGAVAKEKAEKKRDIIEARRLQHHKLKKGEHIIIDTVAFVPFDNQLEEEDPIGRIDGLYSNDEDSVLLTEAYGVHKSEYVEGAAYIGRIMCLRCDDDPVKDTIVLYEMEPLKPEDDDDEGIDSPPNENFTEEELRDELDYTKYEDDDDVDATNEWDDEDWEHLEDMLNEEVDEEEDTSQDAAPRFRGPSGRLITERAFEALTDGGCRYCGCNIDSSRADEIGWMDVANGGGVACPKCYQEYKTMGVFLDYSRWMH